MLDHKDPLNTTGIRLPFKSTDLPQWLQDMMVPCELPLFEISEPPWQRFLEKHAGQVRTRKWVDRFNVLGRLLAIPARRKKPLWKVGSYPTISLADIRARRFVIIERHQSLAYVQVGDDKVFEALDRIGEDGFPN